MDSTSSSPRGEAAPSRCGSGSTPRASTGTSASAKNISLPIVEAHAGALTASSSHKCTSTGANGHARVGRNAWQSGHAKIKHSRAGFWRAIALIAVHVLIVAHVIQWLVMGMTLSPLEPSESMQTLRSGVVNAGFVLFTIAIVSTLVLGRFFCGWGCHVVAMQDLCAWLMMKLGVKPKPFRSRVMIYMPLALALYMFVWPVAHREVIRPVFGDEFGRLPSWLGQSEPLPSLKTEFFVQDFWATFPSWQVAIPFLFVIGFAIVYFLGSKGFCSYGCPYGGFFAPSDLIAPGKIRVNQNCHQCGHCTAVCTSNVRVHEEVRDFGMVVDPGCMKCLDCVSVCPNDALYFGIGKPTVLAKPREGTETAKARRARAKASREARFDMTRAEDWLISLVFVAMFLAYRGMLNEVPMLMAVAMAAIGAFLVHKLYRCLRDPSVRLQNLQLRVKGKWTAWGRVYAIVTLVAIATAAWSGVVRTHVWLANEAYAKVQTPWAVTLRDDYAPSPTEAALARQAIRWYTRGSLWSSPRGWPAGVVAEVTPIGWSLSGEEQSRLAHLHAIIGDLNAASAWLEHQVSQGQPSDALVFQVASLRKRLSPPKDAQEAQTKRRAFFESALDKHPYLDQVRAQLAAMDIEAGERKRALDRWQQPLSDRQVRTSALFGAASTHALLGENTEALALLARVGEDHRSTSDELLTQARMTAALGKTDQARTIIEQAAATQTTRGGPKAAAASALLDLGLADQARTLAGDAAQAAAKVGPHAGKGATLRQAGLVLLQTGQEAEGLRMLERSIDALGFDAWELQAASTQLAQLGLEANLPALLKLGMKGLESGRALQPDAPTLLHDLAQVYYAAGERDKAVSAMQAAAETGRTSPLLAERYAELLSEVGRTDEARKWADEARKRRDLLKKPADTRP